MRSVNTELKVGAFALGVILILSYMTFRTGGMRISADEGYRITVMLDDSAGIDLNTKVKVAGVDAGRVAAIDLDEGRARITLAMDPGVVLHDDAEISIRSMGFLGDRYLALTTGSADAALVKEGGAISNYRQTIAFDQLATRMATAADSLSNLADSLNETMGGGEVRDNLLATMENIRALSDEFRQTLDRQDTKLYQVMDQIQELAKTLKAVVEENREPVGRTAANLAAFSDTMRIRGPELADQLAQTVTTLQATAEATKEPILRGVASLESTADSLRQTASSFQDVAGRIQKGEGTLGKLVTDEKLYDAVTDAAEGINKTINKIDRFRTFVEFRGEYLEKTDAKGYFTVTFQPRKDKYYLIGIVSDQEGRSDTTTTIVTGEGGTITTVEERIESEIEFTAQFARRFDDLALRIGVTESTFGAGADYFLLDDAVRLTADMWDFGHDEPGADEAHLKIGMDYAPFRNVFLWAGYDNVLNEGRRGYFLGGGVRFEDEDLKYLFGTASSLIP